jgi:hypothetical protein
LENDMTNVTHLPTSAEERALDLPGNASTSEEALRKLSDGLTQAVRHMDDVSLTVDATPGRMVLRFRAVRHRGT